MRFSTLDGLLGRLRALKRVCIVVAVVIALGQYQRTPAVLVGGADFRHQSTQPRPVHRFTNSRQPMVLAQSLWQQRSPFSWPGEGGHGDEVDQLVDLASIGWKSPLDLRLRSRMATRPIQFTGMEERHTPKSELLRGEQIDRDDLSGRLDRRLDGHIAGGSEPSRWRVCGRSAIKPRVSSADTGEG